MDPEQIGEYPIRGRLGEGGQGVVYMGSDAAGGKVAIKVLRPEVANDPYRRDLFLREITLARRVARFCTAQVLDAGFENGQLYVVSEFIEGRSLREEVADTGPLTGAALDRLAVGTATALAAIHAANIVHRDFKPGNVMLGRQGLRVIDFGIARALDSTTTHDGRVAGTLGYMAPEQMRGEPPSPAADVYAWARVMLYAATGSPASPPRINDLMGGRLAALVTDSLAEDPSARPTSDRILLRLVGRDTDVDRADEEVLEEAATRIDREPVARRPRRWNEHLIYPAVALATALVTVTVFVLLPDGEPRSGPDGPPTAGGQRPKPGPLPGGGELVTNPDGILTLTSYRFGQGPDSKTYVLDPKTGEFRQSRYTGDAVVSPDGSKVAGFTDGFPAQQLAIEDRHSGQTRNVSLPAKVTGLRWSPDGSRILSTAWQLGLDEAAVRGAVVTWTDGRTRLIEAAASNDPGLSYLGAEWTWDREGKNPIIVTGGQLSRVNADTAVAAPDTKLPTAQKPGLFAPGASLTLASRCGDLVIDPNTCLWNLANLDGTPDQPVLIRRLKKLELVGWYDALHLIVVRKMQRGSEAVITDLEGRNPRVLVKGPSASSDLADRLHFTPVPR